MIRAAAKNYQDVAVVTSPSDYAAILEELQSSGALLPRTHWRLARKAFATTAAYDAAISARLDREVPQREEPAAYPNELHIRAPKAHGPALRRESAPAGRALRAPRPQASPAASNFTARSCLTTTSSILTPHGSSPANSKAPPSPSSSTQIRPDAPSNPRSPRPTARRWHAIPYRLTEA